MSFVSFAQNFEDVMLWRALKHVQHGFYIDVGAAWPDVDSVTRAFYERGWHGINIEPNPDLNLELQERRPHDLNLRMAVSDQEGMLAMNFLDNAGLSTLDDEIAQKHQQAGWTIARQNVQVTTLAAIWQQYLPVGREVHFLKVDVEGFEEAVLRGNDWSRNRPWIVVVEATLPMSQEESHGTWEFILLNANYSLCYVDGLNRYYVAAERADLISAFRYPPNVFDDFVLSHQVLTEARAQQGEVRAQQAEARAQQAELRAWQAEALAQQGEIRAQQAEEKLHAVFASASWRITAPLRWVGSSARKLNPNALVLLTRHRMRLALHRGGRWVLYRPWLMSAILSVLNRLPGVKRRLRIIVLGQPGASATIRALSSVPVSVKDLSPRAAKVYADLKAAVESRKS